MNLPNKLSMLRMIMVPFFVAFALIDAAWAQWTALILFCVASLTDLLDGQIARKYNLVTNFGKFIDPIADKLLTMAAFVVLVGQGRMPSWACIVILGREFIVSGLRLIAVENGKVIAAGWLGKIKTVTQMAAIILTLLLVPVSGEGLLGPAGIIAAQATMYAATAMTLISGADYVIQNRSLFANGQM